MNIEITKRHDSQFPIGLITEFKLEKLTLKAAKEFRIKLNEAIEWAVNMDDIRKESNATHTLEKTRN